MSRTIGVIGGMGPEATVEFLRRLVAATPARDDSDHVRVVVDSNPKIPSRIAHLIDGTGEDPSPVLTRMAQGLERQGADFLVMPCNTAHHYLPAVARTVSIPFLDMVSLAVESVPGKRIAMLASPAVRKVGLYASRLQDAGKTAVFPDAADEATLLEIIRAVKGGRAAAQHRRDYARIAAKLEGDAILIACTELSVLGSPEGVEAPVVDALDVLARASVDAAGG